MMPLSIDVPADADPRLMKLVEGVRPQLQNPVMQRRSSELRKIRDQFLGGVYALQEVYHPPIPGLPKEKQERVRRIRKHVNLVQPALDRLVNTIHAGLIHRSVQKGTGDSAAVLDITNGEEHAEAMVGLCENAFLYGTGYLVPMLRTSEEYEPGEVFGASEVGRGVGDGAEVPAVYAEAGGEVGTVQTPEGFDYWHPDPLTTFIVFDPFQPEIVTGLVEFRLDAVGLPVGYRFLTREISGTYNLGTKALHLSEHDWGFIPLVVAYGRSLPHLSQHEPERAGLPHSPRHGELGGRGARGRRGDPRTDDTRARGLDGVLYCARRGKWLRDDQH